MKTKCYISILSLLVLFLFAVVWLGACGGDDDDDDDDNDAADDDDDDDDDTVAEVVWTDTNTGLMWEKKAEDEGQSLESAGVYCESLVLGGYDDWRIPTISELRTLITGCEATEPGGSCNVSDSCLTQDCKNIECIGCGLAENCYFPAELEAECGIYHSSSLITDREGFSWTVQFEKGLIEERSVDIFSTFVICVRN